MREKTVLVVDDEDDLRALFSMILGGAGYRIVEAGDGPEAIKIACDDPPDMILLDIRLPSMDGWEVLAELQRLPATASIPVIVVSAHAQAENPERAIGAGARAYLTKPVDRKKLLEAVAANSS